MNETTDWDAHFMQFAQLASEKSKDDSSQYGAAIVDSDNILRSTGFNGMPRGVNEHLDYRTRKPYKRHFYEHAERNAIYNAARSGIQTLNCTIYLLEPPCAPCARAIIQAGITQVVCATNPSYPKGDEEDWRASVEHGLEQMLEAGVSVRFL